MGFNKEKERARAKFAMRLYRWRDYKGRKLPIDKQGVKLHKQMVKDYEKLYGKSTPQTLQMYENIYSSILGTKPKKIKQPTRSKFAMKQELTSARRKVSYFKRKVKQWEKIYRNYYRKAESYRAKMDSASQDLKASILSVDQLEKEIAKLG